MGPLLAIALVLNAPTSVGATAEVVDSRSVLPELHIRKDQYVRYFMRATIRSDEDLPFTTSGTFSLGAPRDVWLGVFVRTPSIWTKAPAGMHVVTRRDQFPEFVHGGCSVVNLVADASTGQTLGSWCNVVGGPVHGRPATIPTFFPDRSPLRSGF